MVVNCEKMMDLEDMFLDRSSWRSWTRASILEELVQFSILIRLMIDDFLTSCSSCSMSGCSRSIERGMWHCGQSGSSATTISNLSRTTDENTHLKSADNSWHTRGRSHDGKMI